jgi:hypothetical protein
MRSFRSVKRRSPTLIVVASFAFIATGWIVLVVAGGMHREEEPPPHVTAVSPQAVNKEDWNKEGPYVPVTKRNPHAVGGIQAATTCVALQPHANVSSMLENFQLCYDEDACTGSLRFDFIDRTLCTRQKRALSSNTTLSKFLMDMVGPDLFRFRLEGPEVIADMVTSARIPVDSLIADWLASLKTHTASSAPCAYEVRLPALRLRGTYRLGLEWLYRDYAAMDELSGHWPPLLKQPLLPVDPNFKTNYHLQQCTLPSTVLLNCRRADATGEGAQGGNDHPHDDVDSTLRPLCSGFEKDTSGRWVADPDLVDVPVYTRVRVKKIQRNPIVFHWALQRDVARLWRPNACTVKQTPLMDITTSLAKLSQRIVVGGDSQLRALYFGLANFVNGEGLRCLRNISTEAAEPKECILNVKGSQRKLIRGVQLDFVDDLFLDRFSGSERYGGYHTVIVGFAQHPASKEHWTFDKYRQGFASRLRRALQLKAAGKHVIWYLAPQYPHTTNGFPVVVRDWRTDLRLKVFNTFAKRECLAHGIPVVDAFSISTPFGHTSPDQAHFSNFVSHELVRMTLTVVCGSLGGCNPQH